MIKKVFSSLTGKFAGILLLSLLLACAAFFGVQKVGFNMVIKNYMSAEAVAARESSIYGEFASYVHKFNLTSRDTEAVSKWSNEHKYATIFIYSGQSLTMQIEGGRAEKSDMTIPESGYTGRLYTLRFADAICRVAVTDTSEARLYAMVNVIALSCAAVLLVAAILSYYNVTTRRIIRLSKEASRISAGDMDAELTKSGHDEIELLAISMDRMRHSVMERMQSENRALQANHDLITAISHDIRTPMTSMLGYLGMLNESDLEDKEKAKAFISLANSKALELKELTDALFKYFLVFGNKDLDMKTEEYDADILIEQLAAEAEYELLDCGFTTKRIGEIPTGLVTVDPLYLKRVIDNVISNVKKYADPGHPVVFLAEVGSGRLSLCVSNNIKPRPEAESTKIGLKTCEKIMEALGGKFLCASDKEHFMAELILPIKPAKEEN